MKKQIRLVGQVSAFALLGFAATYAQAAQVDSAATETAAPAGVDEVIVTSDRAGLLERRASSTVFGVAKPLIETPRSASFASDVTLDRYGVRNITDLVSVSPGAGTASWYGIPGSLNLRGTLADNYFRGFQRLTNIGTYATPIGGASQVDIVRGPPSAIYGPGKVGGFVNFMPKTSRVQGGFVSEPMGSVSGTLGSYGKKNVSADGAAPISLGTIVGGVSGYGEIEDSDSYYRGMHIKYQNLQLAADLDLGRGFTFAAGGSYYHGEGYVQTLVNRLTQDLIDHGTYTTGRDATLVDLDGNGRLTPNEAIGGKSFHTTWNTVTTPPVVAAAIAARNSLDVGVGTTTLSTRDIAISGNDFNDTDTYTYYMDLAKDLGGDRSIKLQLFQDSIKNERFFGYGFPGAYDSRVGEARLTYSFPLSFGGWFSSNNVLGAAYRAFNGDKKESYLGGFTALDRRDIAFGPTGTDVFDDPFSEEPGGIGQVFETQVHSTWNNTGVFGVTDVKLGDRLNITLAARYDDYMVRSRDDGAVVFTVVKGRNYTATDGDWTYSTSATYQLPFNLMPYVTYAKATALELQQAGDIQPGQIFNNTWLSDSGLNEAGVKFQLFNKTLVGSLAVYRQTRTTVDSQTNLRLGNIAKGVEFEFRYLVNKNFSVTVSANDQKTIVKGPDTTTIYVPPTVAGVSQVAGLGGNYRYNFSLLTPGNYTYTMIPRNVGSVYGVYTSDKYSWGTIGGALGAVYTGETQNLLVQPIKFHSNTVVNLSGFYSIGPYGVTLNITNLLDKRYYMAPTAAYTDVTAIPGLGREWRVTLKRSF